MDNRCKVMIALVVFSEICLLLDFGHLAVIGLGIAIGWTLADMEE